MGMFDNVVVPDESLRCPHGHRVEGFQTKSFADPTMDTYLVEGPRVYLVVRGGHDDSKVLPAAFMADPERLARFERDGSEPTSKRGGAMKRMISAAFCLLVVCSVTVVVFAKGTTTKITITGTGLQSAVEISDPAVLKNFNVWSGPGTFANGVEGTEGFIIDWASGAVTDRPNGLRTFELSFYVRYANRPFAEQTDQLAYIVSYAVDPATGQGYVYLPGTSDERYRLNTKAIYRGREGNWFRANAAWQTAFKNVVHG